MAWRGFLFNYPIFIAGMVGIVTVDDLSTGFTIAWQMMTVASFFLIRFDHQDQAITRSANKYLLLMELAWVAIVAAAALIPHAGLGTPLHALTEGLGGAETGLRALIYGLLLFGFGMKVGMFPLGQLWLPDAHSSAPSPISALLSGVMIKTGVYGIVRTLFWMVPPEVQGAGGPLSRPDPRLLRRGDALHRHGAGAQAERRQAPARLLTRSARWATSCSPSAPRSASC